MTASERVKQWRIDNPEKYKDLNRRLRERHRDQRNISELKRYYSIDPEIRRAKSFLRRFECIRAYGGVCICCGETLTEFLTIDHTDGGGTEHRKKIGSGTAFYRWLKKNNYPPGFRILCYSCNCCRGNYGYCPHELLGNDEVSVKEGE